MQPEVSLWGCAAGSLLPRSPRRPAPVERRKVTAQSTWKKSHASIVAAWVRRNCRQVVRLRWGAGGIRGRFSTRRMVDELPRCG